METKDKKQRNRLSVRGAAIISGIIVAPLWFGFIGGVSYVWEDVLGHKERYEGPDWMPRAAVIVIFGTGFFLWKLLAAHIYSLWGEPEKSPGSAGHAEEKQDSKSGQQNSVN